MESSEVYSISARVHNRTGWYSNWRGHILNSQMVWRSRSLKYGYTLAGTKAACINAASMALAHAGIPMHNLVVSCGAGYLNTTPLLGILPLLIVTVWCLTSHLTNVLKCLPNFCIVTVTDWYTLHLFEIHSLTLGNFCNCGARSEQFGGQRGRTSVCCRILSQAWQVVTFAG